MPLYVDKYRPKKLEHLDLHVDVSERLKRMVKSGDFPHLLFYGPSGAGKKTRVNALLGELFGPGVHKTKITHRSFKVGRTATEITMINSNYHIELNPSDVGNKDRVVVQEVIKEMAQTQSMGGNHSFKVVVLNEVDKLTMDAQHALRRTMEKYMTSCRLILCCESACRVAGPLKSRCLPIRVPAPTHDDIKAVLHKVAKKESLTLPDDLAQRIAVLSSRNLRRALLMFEACKVEQYPFQEGQSVRIADWEWFIDQLGQSICQEQSPNRLVHVRNKLYELLTKCVPPEIVMKTLVTVLLRRVDDQIKHEVIRCAAEYEYRMHQGSKPIFHLEAFVAKFMAIYKRWVIQTFG